MSRCGKGESPARLAACPRSTSNPVRPPSPRNPHHGLPPASSACNGDEAKGKIVDILTRTTTSSSATTASERRPHHRPQRADLQLSSSPPASFPPHHSVVGNGLVVDPRSSPGGGLLRAPAWRGQETSCCRRMPTSSSLPQVEDKSRSWARRRGHRHHGRGIGPCYEDKLGGCAASASAKLLHSDHCASASRPSSLQEPPRPRPRSQRRDFDAGALHALYAGYGEKLRPHVAERARCCWTRWRRGSGCSSRGARLAARRGPRQLSVCHFLVFQRGRVWPGSGVPSRCLDKVVGIIKAYTTRVAAGRSRRSCTTRWRGHPARGREFGTVTGGRGGAAGSMR